MRKTKTLELVQISMFSAIIVLLSFLPYVGYIKLPIGIQATTIHIPVIVGSILLGPKAGGILGGVFGLTSFINNTISPGLLSFCFSPITALSLGLGWGRALVALLICFVPRIICGIVPFYVYRGLEKIFGSSKIKDKFYILFSGVLGSFTNTLFVMGLIFVFFGDLYAEKMSAASGVFKSALALVITTVTTNGIFEAVTAALIASAAVLAIKKSKTLIRK